MGWDSSFQSPLQIAMDSFQANALPPLSLIQVLSLRFRSFAFPVKHLTLFCELLFEDVSSNARIFELNQPFINNFTAKSLLIFEHSKSKSGLVNFAFAIPSQHFKLLCVSVGYSCRQLYREGWHFHC